jgi:chemotaxis protein CheX
MHKLDDPMIEQLDSAVAEVFESMLGMTCCPVEPETRFIPNLAVTIGFTGRIEGRCRIGLSHDAARTLMEALVGSEPDCADSMIDDAAGELCNMIVGSWKSQLPPAQAAALLSLPVTSHELIGSLDDGPPPPLKRLYNFNGNLLAMALRVESAT